MKPVTEEHIENGPAQAKEQPPHTGERESATAPADGLKTWTVRCAAYLPTVNTGSPQKTEYKAR